MIPSLFILTLVVYLIGSVPFSYLITRWRTGLNLHEVGEGNVGSRNVWHVVGPSWGFLAMMLDALKGYLCYLGCVFLHVSLLGTLLVGVAVLIGHQFPLYLRGQGGKGLATALGFLIGLTPFSMISTLALLGVIYLFTRNFNPALVVAMIAAIILPHFFGEPLWLSAYILLLALLAGIKKLLDRPHEARVWASHPWEGTAAPGWHEGEEADSGQSATANHH